MRITIRCIMMTQFDIDFNAGFSSAMTLFHSATGSSIAFRMVFAVPTLYDAGFLLTQLGTLLTALAPVLSVVGGISCAILGLICHLDGCTQKSSVGRVVDTILRRKHPYFCNLQ